MWSHAPILTPEKKVWRAVLTQAFDDAEMSPNADESGSEPFECSRARQYLRADNLKEVEHLKLVCEYAEIPADRVISWARRRYRDEHFVESIEERAGAAAAFLADEAMETPEKRALCSRTPENATAAQTLVATEAPALFPTKEFEQTTEN